MIGSNELLDLIAIHMPSMYGIHLIVMPEEIRQKSDAEGFLTRECLVALLKAG